MAIDSQQTRHIGKAWRSQNDGNAGVVSVARPARPLQAALDLRHQTLAHGPKPEGVRRRLAAARSSLTEQG